MKWETLLALFVVCNRCRFSEESAQRLQVPVKNGYFGIVVALPPDVTKPSERTYLVENIKTLFEQASKELFRATDKRLYFASVTLLYPNSWGTSHPHRQLERYGEADVLVFTGPGIVGTNPYTIQDGGCGKNGHKIYLPQDFVNDEKRNDKGKAFLHEWSHYRFGVFEERGFPNDSRYPVFYRVPGKEEAAINDCSNIPLNYSLVNEEHAACELQWHENNNTLVENGCHLDEKNLLLQNAEVTSSLMSMELLSNVKDYCDEGVHNIHSPTKHNIMCNYKDAWKVIQASQDVSSTPHAGPIPTTTFNHIHEGHLRIAVLYSCNAQKQVNFQIFRIALHQFIEESIPDGARMSILGYTISSDGGLNLTSQELRTKEDRTILTKNLEHYRSEGIPYVEPALGKLIKELEERGILQGTTVILVTNGTMQTDDRRKVQTAVEQYKIRMHVIINADDNGISPDIDTLAYVSGGKVFRILELPEKLKELQLLHALKSSLEGDSSLPNSYMITEHIIDPDTQKDRVHVHRIPVDPETEHLFVYIYYDHKSSVIKQQSVSLTATSDEPNTDPRNGVIWFAVTNPEAGESNLTLMVVENKKAPIIIQATSLFRRGANAIHVTSWINRHVINVTPTERVIFYVNVQQGINPVSGARVIATVYYPNTTSSYEMELLDNGLGDPDITANDGIYSRSFTSFGTKGYYFLSIRVDDNDGNAKIIQGFQSTDENKICCGSFIPDLNNKETGPFSRISKFGSFYVTDDLPSEDIYPPNQITDLKVTVLSKHDRKVRLTWTAPGSNYDSDDKVSHYQIKYYRNMEELLKRPKDPCANDLNYETDNEISIAFCVELNDFNLIGGGKLEGAATYGAKETRNITLNSKYFLDDLYFVIYSLDQANNTSPMSNIAPAYVPKVLEPTTEPNENSTGLPLTSGGLASSEIGMIVGIVIGALVLIAIIVLALIWFSRRRKRKDSEANARPQSAASQRVNSVTQRPNGVENGNAISEVSSWSARTLMDHYDSTRNAKKQTISKPITSIQDVLNDTGSDYSYKVEKNDMYEPAYHNKQTENIPYKPTLTSQNFQNSTPKKTTQV